MDRKEFLSQLGLGSAAVFMGACMAGCGKEGAAPARVDFTLDLSAPANAALNTPGGFVYNQGVIVARTQQNAYIERYNRTVQHEWLDQYIIESIDEAQDFAMQWLWTYKNDHPNMGIGCITPAMKLKLAA